MDDEKIVSRIANRDERALELVVNRYSKLLFKAAAPILVNASSAEDIEECVADAFIYLWQHPEKYDPSRGKLSSYLALFVKSRAVDRYRAVVRKREVPIELIAAENLSGAHTESAYAERQREILLSCLKRLGEEEKDLIVRRYYYEQKPKEIAAALGIPKKQLENKLYYTRQKLKKMMEEQKGD